MNFIEKVDKFIIEKKMISNRDNILIGFSGGADSTALLTSINILRSKYKINILAVHINYNLRGKDSLRDEQFVKDFCFKRNISLVIKNVTLETKSDLENKAREIRFKYFYELAKVYKIDKIAVGHNKQDQAETMIFRLFRGSGHTGLRGILPKDKMLIHPLLIFSRNEITQFLEKREINWREDNSNQENNQSRNKIRNQLIPWISENLNPAFIDKLSDTANIFAETDEILLEISKRKYKNILKPSSGKSIEFLLTKLKNIRPTLRFYIYRLAFAELSGSGKDFYQNNFDEIESILDSLGSKEVMLPKNIIVLKEYNILKFCDKKNIERVDSKNFKKLSSLRHKFTFENYRISMKHVKSLPKKRYLHEDKNIIYIDLDKTSFPMIIRHRQPGDKFTPLGMKHTKKLKDFFIDEKVSKFERDKVLLFCDEEKVLWIAGMRFSDKVAISAETRNILMIKLEKLSSKSFRHAERINK